MVKNIIYASHFVSNGDQATHSNIAVPKGPGILSFGCRDEVENYLANNISPFRKGLEHGFDFLIGLEANRNPDFVSLPLDILALSGNGFEWLRKSN